MATIRPFHGIRPKSSLAGKIISPPYDVLSEEEVRFLCRDNKQSFLHVTRPEVNLPYGTDPHSPEAYVAARNELHRFERDGLLEIEKVPCIYLYGQKMPLSGTTDDRGPFFHEQICFLACCSVDEYNRGLIKKHEHTRPDKVEDRCRHIDTLDTQTGLVFLAYRDRPEVTDLLRRYASGEPLWRVTTEDHVVHTLWRISDPSEIQKIQAAFRLLPALYVADGHHRSEAASIMASRRPDSEEAQYFLAGVFPDSMLHVLAYNRLVGDLKGQSPAAFMARLAERFDITPDVAPLPTGRGHFTMYLEGRWFGLVPHADRVPADPVGSLDVSVLQNEVLSPLLGIADPRKDQRIAFVGGIRGFRALQDAVDKGEASVAFHLYPTGLDQLFAVADMGEVMPPKSTWFEPKLRGGVLLHSLSPVQ
jgi:uncharacterized protein (DUF1015 family)